MPILFVFIEIDCESRIWGEASLFDDLGIHSKPDLRCRGEGDEDERLRVFQLSCEAKLVLVKSNEFLAKLTEQYHPEMKPS